MSKKRYSIYLQRSLALKFQSVVGRRKGGKSALVQDALRAMLEPQPMPGVNDALGRRLDELNRTVARIDRDNILQATFWAMAEALRQLATPPSLALVDGNRAPQLPCPVRTVIAGDAESLSIAAASIIAKVTRDRLMMELDRTFPHYGFARHKGYGTALHQACLDRHGPCPQHRRSFAPVAARLAR
ncbi:MAG: ribonuclease HII [Hyphomicrobiales bacterium]|nr:MAG: ribonuclease HII [Hyphomicrobiales bacterium]